MSKQHWMVNLVRIMAIIFVIFGGFLVFWYSPFYSTMVVKVLNTFVPVEVDQVAAKSQQEASLSETEGLEPGSKLWIARQAYLSVMEKQILANQTEDVSSIFARYQILQKQIEDEANKPEEEKPEVPLLVQNEANTESNTVLSKGQSADRIASQILPNQSSSTAVHDSMKIMGQAQSDQNQEQQATTAKAGIIKNSNDTQISQSQTKLSVQQGNAGQSHIDAQSASDAISGFDLNQFNTEENKALMDKFMDFLSHYPVPNENTKLIDHQVYQDIAYIQKQNRDNRKNKSEPYAIVILGGGLTLADNKVDIVVNDYTRLRLEKTLEIEKKTKLPIVLSGVESSYMQAWLKERGVNATLLENRSMNTCENTRFSSLLLQKQGGAPTVLLITDRYHMPRTRRLFALNGIETIPVVAPMPTPLTAWQPSKTNYDHSRRANYEMLATIRDILFDSGGCREVP